MAIDETLDLAGSAPPGSVDTAIADQQSLEIAVASLKSKLSKLEADNHKLRVNNVSLRSRNDALKAQNSFERRGMIVLGLAVWLLFVSVLIYKCFNWSFG
jgi:FtsZ-binding cell division protein ZapB